MNRATIANFAVCLTLGVIATVATAWLCAVVMFDQPYRSVQYTSHASSPAWDYTILSHFPRNVRIWSTVAIPFRSEYNYPVVSAPRWSDARERPSPDLHANDMLVIDGVPRAWPYPTLEHAAGWPFLAMYGRGVQRRGGGLHMQSAIALDNDWPWRVLPLRPMWIGFLLNTVFYGALAAVLWFALRRVRMAMRMAARLRRDQCPNCRYPIGTHPRCTECGIPLHRRPPHSSSGCG